MRSSRGRRRRNRSFPVAEGAANGKRRRDHNSDANDTSAKATPEYRAACAARGAARLAFGSRPSREVSGASRGRKTREKRMSAPRESRFDTKQERPVAVAEGSVRDPIRSLGESAANATRTPTARRNRNNGVIEMSAPPPMFRFTTSAAQRARTRAYHESGNERSGST